MNTAITPGSLRATALALATLLATGLAGTGCDGDVDGVGATVAEPINPTTANPVDAAPTASTTVSASYLAGQWCNLYYSAGGERVDERINYVFNDDGTLLFQNNPRSAVDRPGAWKLEGTELSVDPAIWMMAKAIHSVEPDRFVLGSERVHTVFVRGACDPQAS